jgi:hypothetical protein
MEVGKRRVDARRDLLLPGRQLGSRAPVAGTEQAGLQELDRLDR